MNRPAYRRKGRHGPLYLYRIRYRDPDPGSPVFTWSTWAYDREHALDKFLDSPDGEDWTIVSGPTLAREPRS